MISEFGKYQGLNEKLYDGAKRSSDYLPLSDGTRVAYDLFLPTKKGTPAAQPLPVLFLYTPYLRVFTVFDKDGNSPLFELEDMSWVEKTYLRVRARLSPNRNFLIDAIFRRPWLKRMLENGYAVFVAERPGTGASFGKIDMSNAALTRECNDVLNWIAAQPWCDGKIGMFGDSWQAQVQFAAASTGNPHLKAIMPASTWLDNYTGIMYPGGIYNKGFASFMVWSQKLLDSPLITPVDSDKDGKLLAQALLERRGATTAEVANNVFTRFPYRDSLMQNGSNMWDNASLIPSIQAINRSGIPVYLVNGWYDFLARDNFLIFANLTVPKRMTIRPTDHSNIDKSAPDLDFGAESLRWFDYWLKGMDNGLMKEPPIHYYQLNSGKDATWQTADCWPIPNQEKIDYFMAGSGEVIQGSDGAGKLVRDVPIQPGIARTYTVDYTATSGKKARWTAVEGVHQYSNMRANDDKGLSFTTPALDKPVEIAGHPLVHLWLCSPAPDLDVFAYLEKVDEKGNSTYITEGSLRASHRAPSQAILQTNGLPWHSHNKCDLMPIPPGEPFELVFDLQPTAYRFNQGDRLRVTFTFADADNFDTPVLDPAPSLQLLQSNATASRIELPVN